MRVTIEGGASPHDEGERPGRRTLSFNKDEPTRDLLDAAEADWPGGIQAMERLVASFTATSTPALTEIAMDAVGRALEAYAAAFWASDHDRLVQLLDTFLWDVAGALARIRVVDGREEWNAAVDANVGAWGVMRKGIVVGPREPEGDKRAIHDALVRAFVNEPTAQVLERATRSEPAKRN